MITAQILTLNNEQTLSDCLLSITNICDRVIVTDMGSNDRTVDIARDYGADIKQYSGKRDRARTLMAEHGSEINLMIEPWECLMQGDRNTIESVQNKAYISVFSESVLTKDVRVWRGTAAFQNRIFETLAGNTQEQCNISVYSKGRSDYQHLLAELQDWKLKEPHKATPYYFEACIQLAVGNIDQFMKASEQYMFLDSGLSMTNIMNRYYYSVCQLLHKKKARPALQNLAICLATRPLMAEFWCLTADVHYHLLNNYREAKELYQNAIDLGNRRLKTDIWPMEIVKYRSYPMKMIESCDKLLASQAYFKRFLPGG